MRRGQIFTSMVDTHFSHEARIDARIKQHQESKHVNLPNKLQQINDLRFMIKIKMWIACHAHLHFSTLIQLPTSIRVFCLCLSQHKKPLSCPIFDNICFKFCINSKYIRYGTKYTSYLLPLCQEGVTKIVFHLSLRSLEFRVQKKAF